MKLCFVKKAGIPPQRKAKTLHHEKDIDGARLVTSHTILIITGADLERNGYTSEVWITRKAPIVSQTLKPNKAFPNKEEAENFALKVAKKWIEGNKPKHSQAANESTVDAKSDFSADEYLVIHSVALSVLAELLDRPWRVCLIDVSQS